MKNQETITIYGAGGCGINLTSHFQKYEDTPGYAKLRPVFCDTSRSNMNDSISDDDCFILSELDGSGKVRSENSETIRTHIDKVLDSYKPSKFNVVIFSASGGTGSVFGPLIAKELAIKGLPLVIIVVGDNESYTSSRNTMKTFKTLEAISGQVKAPLIVSWHQNSIETPRYVVNERINTIVGQLALLASGMNRELDSKDVANWVYYHKPVDTLKPQLSLLDITADNAVAQKIVHPISVVNLLRADDSSPRDLKPEYSCAGYLPSGAHGTEQTEGLAYIISLGGVEELAASILKDYEDFYELSKTRDILNDTMLREDDVITEGGLVL